MEHNDTLLCLEFQSIRNHVDYISKIRMKALHISETMKYFDEFAVEDQEV